MAVTRANAMWEGNLTEGKGTMTLPKGDFSGPYTRASRFESGEGTNPEELVGAALAGCFSMFLAGQLAKNDTPSIRIETTATVTMGEGPTITRIALETEAEVPGIDPDAFAEIAERSKRNCPVSKALAAVEQVTLEAKLR